MATYKTEGIIIKRLNYGEADKILAVFTKHYGKIRVLAKGVRKITSRKGGNLELFNWVTLFLAEGKNLDIVTEAQVRDSFAGFRKDLKKVGVAYYFCELIDKLCPERQKNKEAFFLLVRGLRDLEKKSSGSNHWTKLKEDFEVTLLEELGFWPRGKSILGKNLEKYIEDLTEHGLKSGKFLSKVK